MSGHEEMLRILTHLYPSTKILAHLTQSRHDRNNKKLFLLLFLPLLVCFVLVFACSCVCASSPFFLFLFGAVCFSICSIHRSFPTPLADSFPISSFPHFLISSSRQPDKPDKVKKNYALTPQTFCKYRHWFQYFWGSRTNQTPKKASSVSNWSQFSVGI